MKSTGLGALGYQLVMKIWKMLVVALVSVSWTANAQDAAKTGKEAGKVQLRDIEGMVSAAELPAGFQTKKEEFKIGGQLVTTCVAVVKPDMPMAGVIIGIENRYLRDDHYKRAAYKAYVNSIASKLVGSGLAPGSKKTLADTGTADFSKRVVSEIDFTGPEGFVLHVQVQGLFSDVIGYDIMIMSPDKKEYDALVQWANTIKPIARGLPNVSLADATLAKDVLANLKPLEVRQGQQLGEGMPKVVGKSICDFSRGKGKPWSEEWTVERKDGSRITYAIEFIPCATGGTDMSISLAPGEEEKRGMGPAGPR